MFLLLALPMLALGFNSCDNEGSDETPKIEIQYGEGTFSDEVTVNNIVAEGDVIKINVESNFEWAVKTDYPGWVTSINPNTAGKGTKEVSITIGENTGDAREGAVKFYIKDYTAWEATLTLKQLGAGDPGQDDILYFEDLGKTPPAGNTFVDEYTGWSKESPAGLNQSGVSYESNGGSIRSSSPPQSSEFSGAPILFLNAETTLRTFTINNINIGGETQLILKFGAGVQEAYVDGKPVIKRPDPEELKLYAGFNGESWAELTYTSTIDNANDWYWVEAEFAVPSGTENIYVRLSNDVYQARFDDFQIIAGGNGDVIVPVENPSEEVLKTIAEIRTHQAGGATEPVDGWWIEGVVVSDRIGANLQPYQIAVVDGNGVNSGVMVNYKQGENNPSFNVGDKVRVELTNSRYNPYNGLLQIADVLESDVTLISSDNAVEPVGITVAQLKTGDYESMLVSINDVEIVEKTPGLQMGGNINVVSGTEEFIMRTVNGSHSAAFANELAPMGVGTLIGIAGVFNDDYQVMPRNMDDVADMQDENAKLFGVSPNTAQTVGAAAGTFTFNVSGNVAWTVISSDDVNFAVAPASGSNNGEVVMTYTENTSTENTRSAVITFQTDDTGIAEADRVIEVTVTQSRAIGGDVQTFTETFIGFASTNNSYTAAAATGSYTSTEVSGVVWDYTGTAHNQNDTKFVIGRWQPTGANQNPGSLTSNSISGGIGSLSIDWRNAFNDAAAGYDGGNSFRVLVNGVEVGVFNNDVPATGTEGTYTIDNIDVSGDFVLRIESNERGRPGVNAISWTTFN